MENPSSDPLLCTDVGALAGRLRDPEKGIKLKDRWSLLGGSYPKTFLGSECANWVFKNVVGLRARKEAVAICQQLLDAGIFRAISKNRQGVFYDASVLYRFSADFVAGECEAGEEDHDILGDEIKITSDQMDDALLGMREGVEVKKRRQFLWSYDDCFVASEGIDWLVEKFCISRVQAVEVGQKMKSMGFFEHVSDSNAEFADNKELYRFLDPEAAGPQITDKTTIYDFNALDIDKNPVSLSEFAGQVVVIVNVASF